MPEKEAHISTSLTVQECIPVFESAVKASRGVGSRLGGMAAHIKGNVNSGAFDPPIVSADPPTFKMGIFVPKASGGGLGNGTAVCLYVWDEHDRRLVTIRSPHSVAGLYQASKLVKGVCNGFRQADPGCEIVDRKGDLIEPRSKRDGQSTAPASAPAELPPLVFGVEHVEPLKQYGRWSLLGDQSGVVEAEAITSKLLQLGSDIQADDASLAEAINYMTASAGSHEGFMAIGTWRFFVDLLGEDSAAIECPDALAAFTKAIGSLPLGNRRQFLTQLEITTYKAKYVTEPPQTTPIGAPADWGPGGSMPSD